MEMTPGISKESSLRTMRDCAAKVEQIKLLKPVHNVEQCATLSLRVQRILGMSPLQGQAVAELMNHLQSAHDLVADCTSTEHHTPPDKFQQIHDRLANFCDQFGFLNSADEVAQQKKLIDEAAANDLTVSDELEKEMRTPTCSAEGGGKPPSPWFLSYEDLEFTKVGKRKDRRQKLGKGTYGEVFEATLQQRKVAVKEFDYEFLKVPQHEMEFHKEVRVLYSLRHPNIVEILGASTVFTQSSEVPPFIAFEFLPITLTNALYVTQPSLLADQGTALRIACELADALSYLHLSTPRIIHHDVKPQNVMLTKELQAKLIDFGLSSTVASLAASSSSAAHGVGTSGYKPPEILDLRSAPSLTRSHKVDVYAYGVVLWQVMSKQKPYPTGLDKVGIDAFVMSGDPLPPCAELPLWLLDMVQACRAHDPEQRPEMSTVSSLLRFMAFRMEASDWRICRSYSDQNDGAEVAISDHFLRGEPDGPISMICDSQQSTESSGVGLLANSSVACSSGLGISMAASSQAQDHPFHFPVPTIMAVVRGPVSVPESFFLVRSSEKLVIAGIEIKIDELESAWGDCAPMIEGNESNADEEPTEPAPELDDLLSVRQKVQTGMLLMAYLEPEASSSIHAVLGTQYLVCFGSEAQFPVLRQTFDNVLKHRVITDLKQPLTPSSPADEFHVATEPTPGERCWLVPDADTEMAACYLYSRSQILPVYAEGLFSSVHPEMFSRPMLESYVQFAQLGMRFCKFCVNFVTGAVFTSNRSRCITCCRFLRNDAVHRPLVDLMLDPRAVWFVIAAHPCLRTHHVFATGATGASSGVVSLAEVLAVDPRFVPKLLCRPALAVFTRHGVPQVEVACSVLHLHQMCWGPKTLFEHLFEICFKSGDSKTKAKLFPIVFAILNAAWETISSKLARCEEAMPATHSNQLIQEHLSAIFDPELVSRFISIYDETRQPVTANPSLDPLPALALFFRASVCAALVHSAEQLFRDSEQQLEVGVDLLAHYRASIIPAVDARGVTDLAGMMANLMSWQNPSLVTLVVTRVAPLTPLLNSEHMELEDIIAAWPDGSLPCKIQVLSGKQFTGYVSSRSDLSQVQPPSAIVDFCIRAELEHSLSPDLGLQFAALDHVVRSHSERLFATHANLQAIRSGLRRVGTKLVTNAPCIVLLVCGKGLIPWLDPSLPIELDGYPVDVREAATVPLTHPPDWQSSSDTGRHCVGARLRHKTGYGTIGAYCVATESPQSAPPLHSSSGTHPATADSLAVDADGAVGTDGVDGFQGLVQSSVSGSAVPVHDLHGLPTHLLSCAHVLQPGRTFRFHDSTEIGRSPNDTITIFDNCENSFVDAGLLSLKADPGHGSDYRQFAGPALDPERDRVVLFKGMSRAVQAVDFPPLVSLTRSHVGATPAPSLPRGALVFKVGSATGLSHGLFAQLEDFKIHGGYGGPSTIFFELWSKLNRVTSRSPKKPKESICKQVYRVVGWRWRYQAADSVDEDFSFGEPGDSGSLVFTSNGAAVGLLLREEIEQTQKKGSTFQSGLVCQLEPAIAALERTMGNVSLQMLPISTSGFSNCFDFNAIPGPGP